MDKTWVAVIAVALLVIIAAGWVFYATAGAPMLADWLAQRARFADPGRAEPLYRWSLAVNPYAASVRLSLCDLYRQQGKEQQAEELLLEGITHYATGPDLYMALAAMYADSSRLEEACALLDGAPEGYLSRRIGTLRPDNAAAPPSGTYAAGLPFPLDGGEGTPWYRLNDGPWTMYGAPLALQEGEYTLRVVTLDEGSIPSPVDEYRYRVERLEQASALQWLTTCPFCGGTWQSGK